jgi:hypothetical protein
MIKVWDARPLTPALLAEREALGLVEFLRSKRLTKQRAVESLRSNRTINELVRQEALALVEIYWKGAVHQQASQLVTSLFHKEMVKRDVIEKVGKDDTLSDEVRREAVVLAEGWRVDPEDSNHASWAVVSNPGAETPAYRLALSQAEQACQLAPDNGSYLNTLGVAQYRVGQYQQALESLLRSEKLNAIQSQGSQPADLAFLARIIHQGGFALDLV